MTERLNLLVGLASGQVGLEVTADTEPPEISSCLITPKIWIVNESINLTFEATDNDRLLDTFIIVTSPDSTNTTITNTINYTPEIAGEYAMTCIARDYRYNQDSVATSFIIANPLYFTITLCNTSNVGTDVILFCPDTNVEIIKFINKTDLAVTLPDYYYDIEFRQSDNKISVILDKVNLSQNNDKYFKEKVIDTPLSGFVSNYIIETDYEFESSTVNFNYEALDLSTGINLDVWVCHNWNFAGESCSGEWELIDSIQDKDQQIMTISVTEFSGFGLKESLPPVEIVPTITTVPGLPSTPSDGIMIEESEIEEIKEIEEKLKPKLERPLRIRATLKKIFSLKTVLLLLILLVILESLNYWSIIRNSKKK